MLLAVAPVTWAEPVQTLQQTYFAGEATTLDIELVLGSLEVLGTDGRNVEVEIQLFCSREDAAKCEKRAKRIRLRPRLGKRELELSLENTSRARALGVQATMIVRAPRDLEVEVDMAGGDVTIRDIAGNIEIDSGGGSVDLRGEQDRVGAFKADVGFGSGSLQLRDGTIEAAGLPKSIKWQGSGSQSIEIDLGGGEITARLD
ncbi:MAG: hypothetical protein AAF725_19685 [Acidobacteriota bacterium]